MVWFPNTPVVICAQPNSKDWITIRTNIQFSNTLPFNGGLYGVTKVWRQLVQYPHDRRANPVVAEVPKELGLPQGCCYFLVESMGAMLVAVLHRVVSNRSNSKAFARFKVDLRRRELSRVPGLGDRALFLCPDRCLSVSAKDLPSISANFAVPTKDHVTVHSLDDGSFESPETLCHSHDQTKMIRPSVQPFTIADHLITYCHRREWTRGLMFHEFHFIPTSWRASDRALLRRIPKL